MQTCDHDDAVVVYDDRTKKCPLCAKEDEVINLKEEVKDKQRTIDDLEKDLEAANSNPKE